MYREKSEWEKENERENNFQSSLQNRYQNPGTSGFYPDYPTTFAIKRARKHDRNWRRVELDEPRNYFYHYGPRVFFFFIFILRASVNPQRRSLARWYIAMEQWKKLSARTVTRPLIDIGGQVDARHVCMHACICVRPNDIGLRPGSVMTIQE